MKPKPRSSESPRIVSIQIERALKRADSAPTDKKQAAILDKVWEWSGILRRQRTGTEGNSIWPVLWFATAACVSVGIFIAHRISEDHLEADRKNGLYQILNRYDGHHYRFNEISTGLPLRVHFCEKKGDQDAAAQLSAGFTIWRIRYHQSKAEDGTACWDIESDGYGYRLMQNPDGTPTLAPNCHAGKVIYECYPNLTEAEF